MTSAELHGPQNPHLYLVTPDALCQMRHDIRTPLGTILGLADILTSTSSTPQQMKIAATLKSSAEALQSQIEALFDALEPTHQEAVED